MGARSWLSLGHSLALVFACVSAWVMQGGSSLVYAACILRSLLFHLSHLSSLSVSPSFSSLFASVCISLCVCLSVCVWYVCVYTHRVTAIGGRLSSSSSHSPVDFTHLESVILHKRTVQPFRIHREEHLEIEEDQRKLISKALYQFSIPGMVPSNSCSCLCHCTQYPTQNAAGASQHLSPQASLL